METIGVVYLYVIHRRRSEKFFRKIAIAFMKFFGPCCFLKSGPLKTVARSSNVNEAPVIEFISVNTARGLKIRSS